MNTLLVRPTASSSSGFDRPSAAAASGEWARRVAQVALFGPVDGGWKLRQPLMATIEREADGGGMVVADQLFSVYGVGENWDEAIADYKAALAEFVEITASGEDEGSRRLLKQLLTYLARS